MPLDLTARRFRDAFDRHDLRNLKAGMLIDEPRHLSGKRQKLGELTAMQDEDHELIGLRTAATRTCDHDLTEVKTMRALRNRLEVMRIVVLTVDENNLFRAA